MHRCINLFFPLFRACDNNQKRIHVFTRIQFEYRNLNGFSIYETSIKNSLIYFQYQSFVWIIEKKKPEENNGVFTVYVSRDVLNFALIFLWMCEHVANLMRFFFIRVSLHRLKDSLENINRCDFVRVIQVHVSTRAFLNMWRIRCIFLHKIYDLTLFKILVFVY